MRHNKNDRRGHTHMIENPASRRMWMVTLIVAMLAAIIAGLCWLSGQAIPTASAMGSEPFPVMISELAWSGTNASSNDEWIELTGTDFHSVPLDGWTIAITRTTGVTATIALPDVTVPVNGVVVIERTDNNTISTITSTIYSGSLPNSDIDTVALVNPEGEVRQTINGIDGDWPAGSSESRASMQWNFATGEWFTSNRSNLELDADGFPILGTPGELNDDGPSMNPVTCSEPIPDNWEPEFEFVIDETSLFTPTLTVDTEVYGVDQFTYELIKQLATYSFEYQQDIGQWELSNFEVEGDASDACTDAVENMKDSSDNILNQLGYEVPPSWTLPEGFVEYHEAIVDFQSSRVHMAFLTTLIKDE